MLTPKSPRMVPGAALEPNVAPIMLRAMVIAPLPRTAITRTGLLVMSQNVAQPSAREASGRPSARTVRNGRKPAMKNVVHTSTFSTPCTVSP